MKLSVLCSGATLLTCALASGCAHSNRLVTNTDQGPPPLTLTLDRLYENPVGPYGLEPTADLLGLAGKRVRIAGFMVAEQEPLPGQFKLALLPVKLAEREDGPADDLPAATVFVHLSPANAQRFVKFNPGVLEVVGTLDVGPREEPDGRVSQVRLVLDQPFQPNGVLQ